MKVDTAASTATATQPPLMVPDDSLASSIPSLTNVWIPLGWVEFDEDRRKALDRFLRYLPVSAHLKPEDLVFLHLFAAPFFNGEPVVVTPLQLKQSFDRYCAKRHKTTTVELVVAGMRQAFAATNSLVFGQFEAEFNCTSNELTLRFNADNHVRLVDFLCGLIQGADGEV